MDFRAAAQALEPTTPIRLNAKDHPIALVANNLYGYRGLWLKEHLPGFLEQNPPFWHRRKSQENAGTPGALFKYKKRNTVTKLVEAHSGIKIFLVEVLQTIPGKLPSYGTKDACIQRINAHYARNADTLSSVIADVLMSDNIGGNSNHFF